MDILRLRDNRFGSNGRLFSLGNGDCWTASADPSDGLEQQSLSNAQRQLLEQWFRDLDSGMLESLSKNGVIDLSGSHLDSGDRKSLRFLEYHAIGDNGFRLDTGNLMGVLRVRDHKSAAAIQIEVLSRFDKGANNFFLNYLLSKAFDVGLGNDSVTATQPSVLDLLLDVLFVRRLGEAAKNGLLRQCPTYRNNDWNFKGRLDLPRHIRENFPLPHGIAYVKREIDLDVPVNRLLLLAALVVRKRRPDLFERNEDASDAFRELRTAIPDPGDIRSVLSHRDCREPVRHPFYREIWEPLRQIARMILEEEKWQLFHESEEAVSGVVFDGAWLWEEYVATILVPKGFRHCVRWGDRLYAFKDPFRRPFYPDFLLPPTQDHGGVVLDTKYKRSNPTGARSDVHQVLCYLLLSGAMFGGLVFPPVDCVSETSDDLDEETYGNGEKGGWSIPRTVNSPNAKNEPVIWSCYSWAPIQTTDDWNDFVTAMQNQVNDLLKWRMVYDKKVLGGNPK